TDASGSTSRVRSHIELGGGNHSTTSEYLQRNSCMECFRCSSFSFLRDCANDAAPLALTFGPPIVDPYPNQVSEQRQNNVLKEDAQRCHIPRSLSWISFSP